MRCKHSHAWEFFLDSEMHYSRDDDKNRVCRWCPECGAIAFWNKTGQKVIWKKPQNK